MALVDASVNEYQQSRIQEPDGVIRMHWRATSLGVSGGGSGETVEGQAGSGEWWCGTSRMENWEQ